MRILFAAPSRDLLSCYRKLLSNDEREVVTAFDATQIKPLLGENEFDIAIVDKNLPRLSRDRVLGLIKSKAIPIVLLIDRPVTPDILLNEDKVNAFLSYPFAPSELAGTIDEVLNKLRSDETYELMGESVSVSAFELPGGSRLTSAETDTLIKLARSEWVSAESGGVYVAALNQKLDFSGIKARIGYIAGEGFKLVTLA